MRLTKLNSDKLVSVNLGPYSVDWDRKVSEPQLKTKTFLRQFWENDAVYEEILIPGSLCRIDLLNTTKMIICEVSPDVIHVKYNKFMHGNRFNFLKKLKADSQKLNWAIANNFSYVDLSTSDIKNLSAVLFRDKFGVNL